MSNLPHTISLGTFEQFDLLKHGIPTTGLNMERRNISTTDIVTVIVLLETSYNDTTGKFDIVPDMLKSHILAALMIVADAIHNIKSYQASFGDLPENNAIGYNRDEEIIICDDGTITFSQVSEAVDAVNTLYKKYVEKRKSENRVEASIISCASRYYGECVRLNLPDTFGPLTADSIKRIDFSPITGVMTSRALSMNKIRALAYSQITQSITKEQPSVRLLKGVTINDLSSPKYNELLQNAVVQFESDMTYTSPVQTAEPFIETDLIRQTLAQYHHGYFTDMMGADYNSDYLKTEGNELFYLMNIMGSLGSIEVLAFTLEHTTMTQVYLPVQKIVQNRDLNAALMSAFFEAFACIALINMRNTNTLTKLVIKYPSTAAKEDFSRIMFTAISTIRKRNVEIYFYDTDEELLKTSGLKYTVVN